MKTPESVAAVDFPVLHQHLLLEPIEFGEIRLESNEESGSTVEWHGNSHRFFGKDFYFPFFSVG